MKMLATMFGGVRAVVTGGCSKGLFLRLENGQKALLLLVVLCLAQYDAEEGYREMECIGCN